MSRYRREELCRMRSPELNVVLAKSPAPEPRLLAGHVWRGYNVPPYTALLGIRKFAKEFFKTEAGVEGCNIPVEQNAFEEPWRLLPEPATPKRFGFFSVRPAGDGTPHPGTTELDYGVSPRNAAWRPERLLRDYVVQPNPDNPDLMLGKAYLALGALVPVGFFVIERMSPSSWAPR